MSFGTIETLPLEVFESIVSHLSIADEARLYATCRRLHDYGRPLLLLPPPRNQRALLFALRRDDLALFRRCVEHGASPAVVTVSKTKGPEALKLRRHNNDADDDDDEDHASTAVHRPRVRTPRNLSTLALSARRDTLRIFTHLHAQNTSFGVGASPNGVTARSLRSQLRALVKSLVSPGKLGRLRRLIDHGFLHLVQAHTDADVAWPLSRAIVAGADAQLVRRFLDAGADLHTAAHEHAYFGSLAPLAAAMATGRADLVPLLVRRGAAYEPSRAAASFRPARPGGTRHHPPLFAAVRRLASTSGGGADDGGDAAMVAACLENGCDVNRAEARAWPRGFNWDWRPRQQHTTPLLEFLDAIPDRHASEAQKAATLANLSSLLQAGARTPHVPDRAGGILQTLTPSVLELLLDKWPLEALNDDYVFSLVTMLVEAGCMAGACGRLMRRYCRGVHNLDPHFIPSFRGWRRLLDLLLTQPGPDGDPSVLLLHLLVDSGTKEMASVERMLIATAEHLLDAGADINAPVSSAGGSPLHLLCGLYAHPSPEAVWWHRSPYQMAVVRHRTDLLRWMVSRGADPEKRFAGGTSAVMELGRYICLADPSTKAWIATVARTLEEGVAARAELTTLN